MLVTQRTEVDGDSYRMLSNTKVRVYVMDDWNFSEHFVRALLSEPEIE